MTSSASRAAAAQRPPAGGQTGRQARPQGAGTGAPAGGRSLRAEGAGGGERRKERRGSRRVGRACRRRKERNDAGRSDAELPKPDTSSKGTFESTEQHSRIRGARAYGRDMYPRKLSL